VKGSASSRSAPSAPAYMSNWSAIAGSARTTRRADRSAGVKARTVVSSISMSGTLATRPAAVKARMRHALTPARGAPTLPRMPATAFALEQLLGLVDRFAGRRLLVLGDLMLDHYLWGRCERISPEAPVPVVEVQRESSSLGGAGNVAA